VARFKHSRGQFRMHVLTDISKLHQQLCTQQFTQININNGIHMPSYKLHVTGVIYNSTVLKTVGQATERALVCEQSCTRNPGSFSLGVPSGALA